MKNLFLAFAFATVICSCKASNTSTNFLKKNEVQVAIDLNTIEDDKVLVTIIPPKIETEITTFNLPKIIPGAYSIDDYGKYIDDLKAYDSIGNPLIVIKKGVNTWQIKNAKALAKITYLVNDTFDIESRVVFKKDVFSPSGTNINAGINFLLNMHGFVGYFQDKKNLPYSVKVSHPVSLWGATSMIDLDPTDTTDLFISSRYAELVESPIMYSKPDYNTFTVDGMEILIAVYSPTEKVTANSIAPELKKMITAQKAFLGKMNTTKKYSVLLYLSTMKNDDASTFGALEHPTETTVVLPEMLPKDELEKELKDVVSHEFFHTITPLTIHSKEIADFDYNTPKMSEHLWLYEGVTEYFAHLFQINQGLISEDDFYSRIAGKIENASTMNDTMPFTAMSENVLSSPYKEQYDNVYEKGALIGMCLDIIIRENSDGKRGILDLMRQLSNEYGATKPFNDSELFAKITSLTYPEVGAFLEKYVAGKTPIPFDFYLAKVGITKTMVKTPGYVFEKNKKQYLALTNRNKEIIVDSDMELNEFFTNLGLKGGDIIMAINGKDYTPNNVNEILVDGTNWKENDAISIKIKRDNTEQIINGFVKLPYEEKEGFKATDTTKTALKEAWLKG